MARYRSTITGRDYDAMADLVRRYHLDIVRTTLREEKGGFSVQAFVDGGEIRKLKSAGYRIERHEDAIKAGKARQAEVGRGELPPRPGEGTSRAPRGHS